MRPYSAVHPAELCAKIGGRRPQAAYSALRGYAASSDFSFTAGEASDAGSGTARRAISISARRMSLATLPVGPTPLAATRRPSAARWKNRRAPSPRSRTHRRGALVDEAGDLQGEVVLVGPEPRHHRVAARPRRPWRARRRHPGPGHSARPRGGCAGRHRARSETSSSRRPRRCRGRTWPAGRRPRCRSPGRGRRSRQGHNRAWRRCRR